MNKSDLFGIFVGVFICASLFGLVGSVIFSSAKQANTPDTEIGSFISDGEIKTFCVEGVEYFVLKGWRRAGLTAKYGTDGNIITCEEE